MPWNEYLWRNLSLTFVNSAKPSGQYSSESHQLEMIDNCCDPHDGKSFWRTIFIYHLSESMRLMLISLYTYSVCKNYWIINYFGVIFIGAPNVHTVNHFKKQNQENECGLPHKYHCFWRIWTKWRFILAISEAFTSLTDLRHWNLFTMKKKLIPFNKQQVGSIHIKLCNVVSVVWW